MEQELCPLLYIYSKYFCPVHAKTPTTCDGLNKFYSWYDKMTSVCYDVDLKPVL